MKRFRWICCLAIAVAALALPGCKKKGPVAQVVGPTFDFGTADQESQVQHTYMLRNAGDQPLEIVRTHTTCGCTVASPTKMKLAPGETSNIDVTFSTGHRTGKQEKHITVETNDAKNPKASLILTGEVIQKMKFDPARLFLKDLEPGQEAAADVTITNIGAEPTTIAEIKPAEGDPVTVKLGKTVLPLTLKPNETAAFSVALTPGTDKPFIHGRIDLTIQGPVAKTYGYYVSGQMKNAANSPPPVAAAPPPGAPAGPKMAPQPFGVGHRKIAPQPETTGTDKK